MVAVEWWRGFDFWATGRRRRTVEEGEGEGVHMYVRELGMRRRLLRRRRRKRGGEVTALAEEEGATLRSRPLT